jgi:hypothetical protein
MIFALVYCTAGISGLKKKKKTTDMNF